MFIQVVFGYSLTRAVLRLWFLTTCDAGMDVHYTKWELAVSVMANLVVAFITWKLAFNGGF